jgi:hypothetical protein
LYLSHNDKINEILNDNDNSFLKELAKAIQCKLSNGNDIALLDEALLNVVHWYLLKHIDIDIKDVISILKTKNQKRYVVIVRQFYFWYKYFRTPMTETLLAESFNKNHATISHSLTTFYNMLITNDGTVNVLVNKMKQLGYEYNVLLPQKINTWNKKTDFNTNFIIIDE